MHQVFFIHIAEIMFCSLNSMVYHCKYSAEVGVGKQ